LSVNWNFFHPGRRLETKLYKLELKDSITPVSHKEFPVCYGYGAGRRMGQSNLGTAGNQFYEVMPSPTLFFDDAELLNAEEWLHELHYSSLTQSQVKDDSAKLLRQVVEVLTRILPDVDDIQFAEPTTDERIPKVQFLVHGAWISISGISYGYRTLIAWMVDFASQMFERYPDSEDPLAEPAVVLVDEIDLHLHPKWQRQLMSYLSDRFPNTQFIATAHSPLIVQAAQDANIAVCRWEGDHVVIDNDVEAIKGWRIDQVLTSDLFGLQSARPPQLDEKLAERKKILTKAKLTKSDERRLKALNSEIGSLPVGETAEQAKTISLLEETLEVLKNREK
jgi:predicted ATP-binding protein involved in virulence